MTIVQDFLKQEKIVVLPHATLIDRFGPKAQQSKICAVPQYSRVFIVYLEKTMNMPSRIGLED